MTCIHQAWAHTTHCARILEEGYRAPVEWAVACIRRSTTLFSAVRVAKAATILWHRLDHGTIPSALVVRRATIEAAHDSLEVEEGLVALAAEDPPIHLVGSAVTPSSRLVLLRRVRTNQAGLEPTRYTVGLV